MDNIFHKVLYTFLDFAGLFKNKLTTELKGKMYNTNFVRMKEEPADDGSIFVCFLCEKEFTKVQELNNHMKVHAEPIVVEETAHEAVEMMSKEEKKVIKLKEKKDFFNFFSTEAIPVKTHVKLKLPSVPTQKKDYTVPKTSAEIMAERALKVQMYIQARENKSVTKTCKEDTDNDEHMSTNEPTSMSSGTIIMSEPEGFVCPKQVSDITHSKFHNFSPSSPSVKPKEVSFHSEDEVNFFSEGSASKYTSSRVNNESASKYKRGRPPNRQKQMFFDRHFEDGNFLANRSGHRSGELENEVYKCNDCNKEFRSLQTLKVHMKSHAETKEVTCPMCEAVFPQRHVLYEHIINDHEENLSDLVCSICSKIFTRTDSLKSHMVRMHNQNGGLNCMICGKNFPSQAQLEIHVRVHTGERPFSCLQCGRGFVQKVHLKTHMRTMHNIVDPPATPCRLCGMLLDCKTNLRSHYTVKHAMSTQQYRREVSRLRREGKIPEKIPPTVKVVSPNFTYKSVSAMEFADDGGMESGNQSFSNSGHKKARYRSSNLNKVMNANDDIMFSPNDVMTISRNEDELKFVESAFKVAEEMDLIEEGNASLIVSADEASTSGIYYTLPPMMGDDAESQNEFDLSSDEISQFEASDKAEDDHRVRVVMAEPLEAVDADSTGTVEMLSM